VVFEEIHGWRVGIVCLGVVGKCIVCRLRWEADFKGTCYGREILKSGEGFAIASLVLLFLLFGGFSVCLVLNKDGLDCLTGMSLSSMLTHQVSRA
jgi:hypothetical protein